jgi:hypothetical protein
LFNTSDLLIILKEFLCQSLGLPPYVLAYRFA